MSKSLVLVTNIAALIWLTATGCQAPGRSPGEDKRTGFEPAHVDVGRLPWHSTAPFASTFVNNRKEAAIIAALKSSCSCTILDRKLYVGKVIEPGESIEISGELNVGRLLGNRTNELELMLTNGAIYVLTLEHEGYPTYTYEPEMLDFGEVDLDSADACVSQITFTSQTAKITSEIKTDSSWLKASYRQSGEEDATIFMQIDRRYLPHGSNYAMVTITTDDLYKPEFSVRVKATGVAAIRAVPGHLFLMPFRESVVRFTDRDGKAVQIASIDTEIPNMYVYSRPGGSSLALEYRDHTPPDEGALEIWITSTTGDRGRFLVTVLTKNKDPHRR